MSRWNVSNVSDGLIPSEMTFVQNLCLTSGKAWMAENYITLSGCGLDYVGSKAWGVVWVTCIV